MGLKLPIRAESMASGLNSYQSWLDTMSCSAIKQKHSINHWNFGLISGRGCSAPVAAEFSPRLGWIGDFLVKKHEQTVFFYNFNWCWTFGIIPTSYSLIENNTTNSSVYLVFSKGFHHIWMFTISSPPVSGWDGWSAPLRHLLRTNRPIGTWHGCMRKSLGNFINLYM